MKRVIVLACMGALLGSWEKANAGMVSAGTISLYGTGIDSNFNHDSSLGDVYLNFQGGLALFDGATQTSYGQPIFFVNGVAAYTSTASIRAFDGQLGVTLFGSGEGGNPYSPFGGGTATVSWTDGVTLFWKGSGPAPLLPSYLNINSSLDAELTTSLNGVTGISSWIYSSASVSLTFGQQSLSWSIDKNAVFNPTNGNLTLSPQLGFKETLDQGGHTSLNYSMTAGVQVTYGSADVNAGHTFKIDSITLPDGNTPESEGWGLRFDSGIESPNIQSAVVPEPSSLALLGTATLALALAGYAGWRRRRLALA